MTIITIISIIIGLTTKSKRNKIWKNTWFLLFMFNIISYISVNIKLPYGCTMDFRYIFSTLFVGTMFICFNMDKTKFSKQIYNIILVLTLILLVSANTIILCS